jgi:hypothetical protein
MRWLAIWLFLTMAWVAGWAVSRMVLGADGGPTRRETVAHLIVVPLAQVAALRALSAFRRMFRDSDQFRDPDQRP